MTKFSFWNLLLAQKNFLKCQLLDLIQNLTVNCTSDRFFVYDRNNRLINKFKVKEPLSCLKKFLPIIKESRFRYAGGAVGYISYDAVQILGTSAN